MEHELKISTEKENIVTIILLEGDVTAKTGKTIEDVYQKASLEGAEKILLVFDKNCYINSGGIAALILIASESKKRDQKIIMTGVSDHFHKIFEMVGLTKYIALFPSRESAMADLGA